MRKGVSSYSVVISKNKITRFKNNMHRIVESLVNPYYKVSNHTTARRIEKAIERLDNQFYSIPVKGILIGRKM